METSRTFAIRCFNSRLREEATIERTMKDIGEDVSTHASVRRRRLHGSDDHLHRGRFNSRLREEATMRRAHPLLPLVFQLTPP